MSKLGKDENPFEDFINNHPNFGYLDGISGKGGKDDEKPRREVFMGKPRPNKSEFFRRDDHPQAMVAKWQAGDGVLYGYTHPIVFMHYTVEGTILLTADDTDTLGKLVLKAYRKNFQKCNLDHRVTCALTAAQVGYMGLPVFIMAEEPKDLYSIVSGMFTCVMRLRDQKFTHLNKKGNPKYKGAK